MDIDGTLANADHRLHLLPKNSSHETGKPVDEAWQAFFDACDGDKVYPEIRALNNAMAAAGYHVWVLTGRRRSAEAVTIEWLVRHQIVWTALMMRPEDDYRPDTEVKKDMLAALRAGGYEPLFAVEDRAGVTKMWREEGIRCLQVCEGNY
jgi:phosphoglycolate phosphatase-like HAD superfamily hydrolase